MLCRRAKSAPKAFIPQVRPEMDTRTGGAAQSIDLGIIQTSEAQMTVLSGHVALGGVISSLPSLHFLICKMGTPTVSTAAGL